MTRRRRLQALGTAGLAALGLLVIGSKPASSSAAPPLIGVAAQELGLPTFTGWVVDRADIISPAAEQALTRRLAQLQVRTGDQFVVVTVQSLGGETIEHFGLRLGNTWGVGQKGRNNGVLLIVAPKEHKVRIEVGKGLEKVLTNALCSRIIDRSVLPRFRAGDMQGGIDAGADTILARLQAPAPSRKAA